MLLNKIKSIAQLGVKQAGLFAWYQAGLKSGYTYWISQPPKKHPGIQLAIASALPERAQLRLVLGAQGISAVLAEAEEILNGKVRLFGGEPVDLDLSPPAPLKHWTLYHETSRDETGDIKLTWEPGRFGWAITLARAYFLSQEERFAQAFWQLTERFLRANPAYLGPHWMSAQEAALRLTALAFSYPIFAASAHTTPERTTLLAESIAQHAARIPPTLAYARAQNNNHLLTEAMGLITAAAVLPSHPSARRWFRLGSRWFHRGLLAQIAEDGCYVQHSANYHRLMLQAALWVRHLSLFSGASLPRASQKLLAAATHWLYELLDPRCGWVPNLGPNDGAYIFPLSSLPFQDYRPVIQAAGIAFLGERLLPEGAWDEMSLWLSPPNLAAVDASTKQTGKMVVPPLLAQASPHILHHPQKDSWAYVRAARFASRPGHADQLHFDLWWRGLNIALDPGTYRYNAPDPWDNALTSTFVHNTITINEQEQMKRAGRFLYLDWAQSQIIAAERDQNGKLVKMTAKHNGYLRMGIIHQRALEATPHGWLVEDRVISANRVPSQEQVTARLHWLLPDWDWSIQTTADESTLQVLSPLGWISVKIVESRASTPPAAMQDIKVRLVRAGQVIFPSDKISDETNPTWGWFSPTYHVKLPALSFSIKISGALPLTLKTLWELPSED